MRGFHQMAITVRDALKIGGLVDAKILAGTAGLDNVIRAVDIIDVPDAAIWFRRDSLLCTTFYALKDNINAQIKMLEDIKSCGGAALIIFSPERYISHIDERLIKKADELNLPLLQMPDYSYIDVIVPVMSRILDKQVKALEYAHKVHSMMTNIVLKGKGLHELLSSLSALIKKPVMMADAEMILLDATLPPVDGSSNPLLEQWRKSGNHLPLENYYPRVMLKELISRNKPTYYRYGSAENDYLDFFFPVSAGETLYGLLIVPGLDKELEKDKTVAMEAGAMAIALDILKERAIQEAERKGKLDFYNELLLGNIKNREAIISQAGQYGLDTAGSYFVILAEVSREFLHSIKYRDTDHQGDKKPDKKLFRLLEYAMESKNADGVIIDTLGSLVILARVPARLKHEETINYGKNLMLSLRNIIQTHLDSLPVCMASGGYCEKIERISAGYIEAWETIDIGKKLFRTNFALSYDDMAPYHLAKRFLTTTGQPELFEKVYKPLLQYDREKGGELSHTLEVYIECNFSRTKTAKTLHIHRNSLNYRLQKIEELLNQDINSLDPFPFLLASISRRLSS